MTRRARLAVVRDFRAENWPSMDLCADMLLAHWPADSPLSAEDVAPPFRRRLGRLPLIGRRGAAFNADRLLNRHRDLPRELRCRAGAFDLFHVVDHSYAQVVHALPPGRAGVFCHDLDAFRCLLEPADEPRPWWFRWLARRILSGLQQAAVVFHSTEQVGQRLAKLGLIDPARLRLAPYGVAAEFTPESAPAAAPPWLANFGGAPWLLHVGSCIPRKRIDVLLALFARLRQRWPELRLVQVGGTWTPAQAEQIERLDIGPWISQVRGLSRVELAELYRQASLVLVPSEAEGFGLPVIEALACGAAVLASDLPVLREVGGNVVVYCPVGATDAWAEAAGRLLEDPAAAPARTARLARVARYTWAEHARVIDRAYQGLAIS